MVTGRTVIEVYTELLRIIQPIFNWFLSCIIVAKKCYISGSRKFPPKAILVLTNTLPS